MSRSRTPYETRFQFQRALRCRSFLGRKACSRCVLLFSEQVRSHIGVSPKCNVCFWSRPGAFRQSSSVRLTWTVGQSALRRRTWSRSGPMAADWSTCRSIRPRTHQRVSSTTYHSIPSTGPCGARGPARTPARLTTRWSGRLFCIRGTRWQRCTPGTRSLCPAAST